LARAASIGGEKKHKVAFPVNPDAQKRAGHEAFSAVSGPGLHPAAKHCFERMLEIELKLQSKLDFSGGERLGSNDAAVHRAE
jgi:hypothetical protein